MHDSPECPKIKEFGYKQLIVSEYVHFNDHFNTSSLGTRYLALSRTQYDAAASAGAQHAWHDFGVLVGMSAADISSRLWDDDVVRCCFAAQSAYIAASGTAEQDAIERTMMCGRLQQGLSAKNVAFFTYILGVLSERDDYEFRPYWGFTEMLHRMHVSGNAMYEKYLQHDSVYNAF